MKFPLSWRRSSAFVLLLVAIFLLSACSMLGDQSASSQADDAATEETTSNAEDADETDNSMQEETKGEGMTTASGLQYIENVAGEGRAAEAGTKVSVHYTGMLDDGTVFDSSKDRGAPIEFVLGRGQVIPGWDEGIALMQVGGEAKLIIPSDLAYGAQGAGGVIPPNATLTFDVELVDVQDGPVGSPVAPTEIAEGDFTVTESGLMYYDMEEGTGDVAQPGQQVTVHYTGWLEDGAKFDSSLDRGDPFVFGLGQGGVIPGWDEGVAGMKPGGKRQLVIPSELGYGERGAGNGLIPPNATLVFEVELLEAR